MRSFCLFQSILIPTIRYELKHGVMLTMGDVTCQYLIGRDMDEVGIKVTSGNC